MTKWINAKDKPIPKKGKVLAINSDLDQAIVWYEDNSIVRGGWFGACEYGCGGHDYFEDSTHWMPLPEPPMKNLQIKYIDPEEPLDDGSQRKWISKEEALKLFPEKKNDPTT